MMGLDLLIYQGSKTSIRSSHPHHGRHSGTDRLYHLPTDSIRLSRLDHPAARELRRDIPWGPWLQP